MAQVKVWNDNVHTYKEKFREKNIEIPPHSFIWMDEDEAHVFKGTMGFLPKLDADGNKIPEGYKMIRVERVETKEAKPVVVTHDCNACGHKAESSKALDAHIGQEHADLLSDEGREALVKKRGRGRPAKAAQTAV